MKIKKYITIILYLLIPASVGLAIVTVSQNYSLISGPLGQASATVTPTSESYSLISGPLGQIAFNNVAPKSDSYSAKQVVEDVVQETAINTIVNTNTNTTTNTNTNTNTNTPSPRIEDAFVYPNPIKPNAPGNPYYAQKIIFKALLKQAVIKIYDLAGEIITTLNKTDTTVDSYAWDMKNKDGNNVASGIYIYRITDPYAVNVSTQKALGKFSIIK